MPIYLSQWLYLLLLLEYSIYIANIYRPKYINYIIIMNKKQALGARIKEFRVKTRMTQDVLAELVGIDPKHLSRIENGKNYPSLETLEKLVTNLNVTFEDIFEFEHFVERSELLSNISECLKYLNDEKLKFIYKIVKEI